MDVWVLAVHQQQLGGALVPEGALQQAALGIQHQIKLPLLDVERLCHHSAAMSAGTKDEWLRQRLAGMPVRVPDLSNITCMMHLQASTCALKDS